jgi:hypothetical protein
MVFLSFRKGVSRKIFKVDIVSIYVLFVLFVVFLSFFDTNKKLYGSVSDNGVGLSSSFVSEDFGVIYVVRNAFTYIPVMLYYYINREVFSIKFIESFFLFFIFLTPFGVYSFTKIAFGEIPLTLENLLVYGQTHIPFNTYVPFLGLVICMCLYFIVKKNKLSIKILSFSIYLLIVLYTFISSSRQSLLFILIASLVFLLHKVSLRTVIWIILFALSFMAGFDYIISNFNINREVAEKFLQGDLNSLMETNRLNKIQEGFGLMKFHEFIFGAGVGSVPFSGPHNDFVRWIQRVGIFVGLLGFIPFFLLLKASVSSFKNYRNNIYIFISLSSLFTLFTSFFGYPRDDTFQSVFVFIGIILFYALDRKTLIDVKDNNSKFFSYK